MRKFLLKKSFSTRIFAHKIIQGSFISLISLPSIVDAEPAADASAFVSKMNAEHIPFFDQALWAYWRDRCEPVLKYSLQDPFEVFDTVIQQQYHPIMMKVLEELGSPKKFLPKISPHIGVDEAKANERRELLSRVGESEGAIAEEIVLSQWQSVLQSSDPSFRASFSKEPPDTFWNEHYYPALFAAEKQKLDAESTSFVEPSTQNSDSTASHSVQRNHVSPTASSSDLIVSHSVQIPHTSNSQIHEQGRPPSLQNVHNSVVQDADQGIAALMNGAGFNFVQGPDQPLDFLSARFIHEEATSGSRCQLSLIHI